MLSEPLMAAYRLYLQPGETLHKSWWQAWRVERLYDLYRHMSATTKPSVDQILIAHRSLPVWRPTELSEFQTALVRMQPSLRMLLTALGFQLLGCTTCLWLGAYRQGLMQVFSDAQCGQLAALTRAAKAPVDIPPDELPERCFRTGWSVMQERCKDDPLWRALQYTLPSGIQPVSNPSPVDDPLAMLLRLERFL